MTDVPSSKNIFVGLHLQYVFVSIFLNSLETLLKLKVQGKDRNLTIIGQIFVLFFDILEICYTLLRWYVQATSGILKEKTFYYKCRFYSFFNLSAPGMVQVNLGICKYRFICINRYRESTVRVDLLIS